MPNITPEGRRDSPRGAAAWRAPQPGQQGIRRGGEQGQPVSQSVLETRPSEDKSGTGGERVLPSDIAAARLKIASAKRAGRGEEVPEWIRDLASRNMTEAGQKMPSGTGGERVLPSDIAAARLKIASAKRAGRGEEVPEWIRDLASRNMTGAG